MTSLLLAAALAATPTSYERVPSLPGWWQTVRGDTVKASVQRDDSVLLGGQPTARVKLADTNGGWVDLEQSIDAQQFRGKRVRLSAEARTEEVSGWAGLFVRVDGFKGVKSSENTQQRALKGTVGWTPLEIVFDVPEDARQMVISLGQDGTGTTWYGRVGFDEVEVGVPLTRQRRSALTNGGFESGTDGWFLSGEGRKDYAQAAVTDVKHSGAQALKLWGLPTADVKRHATSMQFFDATAYAGKRVRASVWTKTQGTTGRGDFWVRVQGPDSPADGPGLGGGHAYLEPDSEWTEHQSVFDVPENGVEIDLGVSLLGQGTVWVDDASLAVVPKETPLRWGASLAPRNLGFSGK